MYVVKPPPQLPIVNFYVLGGLLGVHLKLKCSERTQDPHHPCVCGARLVIAHPHKNSAYSIKTFR
jgi:hypothetical protein